MNLTPEQVAQEHNRFKYAWNNIAFKRNMSEELLAWHVWQAAISQQKSDQPAAQGVTLVSNIAEVGAMSQVFSRDILVTGYSHDDVISDAELEIMGAIEGQRAAPAVEPVAWNAPEHWNTLYIAVNHLMAKIGMYGEVDSQTEAVSAVMNALYDIDGGAVCKRAQEIHDKASMPLFEATNLAARELGVEYPSAPPAPVAIPSGWKLVPIEATGEMISAMAVSQAHDDEGQFPPLMDILDYSGENKTLTVLRAAYRAMLDAVPECAAQPQTNSDQGHLAVQLAEPDTRLAGCGIRVSGELVAWFKYPGQGEDWATENHFGKWLMHPRYISNTPDFTPEQIAVANTLAKEMLTLFESGAISPPTTRPQEGKEE